MANVLILYDINVWPSRATILDHLYAFRDYARHRCFYHNARVGPLPEYLRRINFDVIVFHTTYLGNRWTPSYFAAVNEQFAELRSSAAVKVALPQDEFIHTDVLTSFLRDFDVRIVFTVAPPTEWAKIYDGLDPHRVRFVEVLTGYLSDATLARIGGLAGERVHRDVDVGYRAWRAEYWLGRHGQLKTQVGEAVRGEAEAAGLVTDISTAPEDVIYGDDWFRFLLRCKYQLGVEGGASILDRDGTLRAATAAFVAANPVATFEEAEAACFPGRDGELALFALSPRHLECCATRTCQVLIAGRYNGALVPGRHYIELAPDFSNLGDVVAVMRRDDLRTAITERAYADVVASGRFSYRHFVRQVLDESLRDRGWRLASPRAAWHASRAGTRAAADDAVAWEDVRRRIERRPSVAEERQQAAEEEARRRELARLAREDRMLAIGRALTPRWFRRVLRRTVWPERPQP